jgi:hypothetical protein
LLLLRLLLLRLLPLLRRAFAPLFLLLLLLRL